MSKTALESASAGAAPTVIRLSDLTEAGLPFAFTVQPASTAPGGTHATNTEYFVSALDFTNTVDNRLVVWALTGTNTLGSASPSLNLTNAVVNTQSYGAPPNAQQKAGVFPLGMSLKEHEELVASNDDRLQQVVFAAGNLWTALNTSAKTANGPVRTAAAYFILTPSVSDGQVNATVANQGYVAINSPYQDSVLYPSIAVNKDGQGLMGFSIVGLDFFPSTGYVPIDAVHGAGAIRIAATGAGPDDGFTGYVAEGGARVGRWGFYSRLSHGCTHACGRSDAALTCPGFLNTDTQTSPNSTSLSERSRGMRAERSRISCGSRFLRKSGSAATDYQEQHTRDCFIIDQVPLSLPAAVRERLLP